MEYAVFVEKGEEMDNEDATEILARLDGMTKGGLSEDRMIALYQEAHTFPESIRILIDAIRALRKDNARLQELVDDNEGRGGQH